MNSSINWRVASKTPMDCGNRSGGVAASTNRVWHAAALRFWGAHAVDPVRIPLDAELFVASQPISSPLADPWIELAHPESAQAIPGRGRQIVRLLRAELKQEVTRAERSIQRGNDIEAVLGRKSRRLSALGAYIIARRAGRDDLAERLAPVAASQHRSCPLYRTASLVLIPAESYPDERLAPESELPVSERVAKTEFASRERYRECEN